MRYDLRMMYPEHRSRYLPMAALGLAGILVSVVIFLGWMRFGGEIFLSLIDSGLAYCF
jgi:hypothetical protein